jgi:hypothetical protein
MTKIWPLGSTLFKKKSNSVHLIVGLQLIAVVITVIMALWKQQYDSTILLGSLLGYGFFGGMILFILLARHTEQVWTNNFYRLLPTTDLQLYVANLVSTLLGYVYFIVIEAILSGLALLTVPNVSIPSDSYRYAGSGMLAFFALVLYGWVFISLVHLIGRTISSWLPEMRSKFVYFLFYVIVGVILIRILNTVGDLLGKLIAPLVTGQLDPDVLPGTLAFSGALAVIILIFSAINIYLLKYRVETKQTA